MGQLINAICLRRLGNEIVIEIEAADGSRWELGRDDPYSQYAYARCWHLPSIDAQHIGGPS